MTGSRSGRARQRLSFKTTGLGTAAQVGLGFTDLDLPMDIRDIAYDVTHLDSIPWWQLPLDSVSLLPIVGALKYTDEVADGVKAAARAADAADDITGTAKHADEFVDAGTIDTKAVRKYNKTIEDYKAAAERAGQGKDTVTYYRVQGGADAGRRSKATIQINQDGTIRIANKENHLSVSAYTTEHSEYYNAQHRGGQGETIAFEVPKWLDDFIRGEAVPQRGYRQNPFNQRGTAPKLSDPATPGFTYELPPIWMQWLEEYATNARILN